MQIPRRILPTEAANILIIIYIEKKKAKFQKQETLCLGNVKKNQGT